MHTSSANVGSGWEVRLDRAQAGGGARCLFGKLALVARASDADAADGLSLSRLQTNASSPSFPLWPPPSPLSLSNPRKPRGKQES